MERAPAAAARLIGEACEDDADDEEAATGEREKTEDGRTPPPVRTAPLLLPTRDGGVTGAPPEPLPLLLLLKLGTPKAPPEDGDVGAL